MNTFETVEEGNAWAEKMTLSLARVALAQAHGILENYAEPLGAPESRVEKHRLKMIAKAKKDIVSLEKLVEKAKRYPGNSG
jgi:hypothetical protein